MLVFEVAGEILDIGAFVEFVELDFAVELFAVLGKLVDHDGWGVFEPHAQRCYVGVGE